MALTHDESPPSRSAPRPGTDAEAQQAWMARLWAEFGTTTSQPQFLERWLALLCHQVGGVRAALLLMAAEDANTFAAGAVWPDPQRDMAYLAPLAQQALAERRGVVRATPGELPGALSCVAYPLEVAGELKAAIVLDAQPRSEALLQQALRQVHWATAWLVDLYRQRLLAERDAALARVNLVNAVVATALQEQGLQASALAAVNLLAQRLQCDRVSLGFDDDGTAALCVVSHTASFDRKTNLSRLLTEAMDEALDAGQPLAWPAEGDALLLSAAQGRLAADGEARAVYSVPLPGAARAGGGSSPGGVLVFERLRGTPFDAAERQTCEVASQLLGPVLALARDNDRGLVQRAWDNGRAGLQALFGPRHPGVKLLAAVAAVVVALLLLVPGTHRVSARTLVEGEVQRATVVPFDGFLADSLVRAGDTVKRGQPMARLDDRDLKLEQSRWSAELSQALARLRQAQAGGDRAAMNVLSAQASQAQAQLDLIEARLARVTLAAPFDGVVVSGDLRQLVGTPLEQGKLLFETAPLDAFRVVLQVDERDIAWLATSQRGELVLSGLPGQVLPFTVQQISPVASVEDGRNVFRVEARIDGGKLPQLRPGMEGVGKVAVGERRLLWIWTHELGDWLRMALWRWGP